MLGDAYGAAVVEALSWKELQEMDQVKEGEEEVLVTLDEEASVGSVKTDKADKIGRSTEKVYY